MSEANGEYLERSDKLCLRCGNRGNKIVKCHRCDSEIQFCRSICGLICTHCKRNLCGSCTGGIMGRGVCYLPDCIYRESTRKQRDKRDKIYTLINEKNYQIYELKGIVETMKNYINCLDIKVNNNNKVLRKMLVTQEVNKRLYPVLANIVFEYLKLN